MAKTFKIDICTPDKVLYTGEVVSLIVPAETGYLGVLADHIPLVASLKNGRIILRDNSDNTKTFSSEGSGFLEVLNNEASIILESVETTAR